MSDGLEREFKNMTVFSIPPSPVLVCSQMTTYRQVLQKLKLNSNMVNTETNLFFRTNWYNVVFGFPAGRKKTLYIYIYMPPNLEKTS